MCKYRSLQITLVILNILVLVCGAVLVGLGSFGIYRLPDYCYNDDYRIQNILIGFTTIGCVLVLLSLFGIVCSFVKNAFIILLYIIFVFIAIVGQTICAIVAVSQRAKIDNNIAVAIAAYVKKYYQDEDFKIIMDAIQTDYNCCGAGGGAADYPTAMIPKSCYKNDQLQSKGCSDVMVQKTWTYLGAMFGCAFAFLVVELVTILIAFLLMNAMDKEVMAI